MGGHEQLMRKETEHAQKQEWFEHKMRLLKQDKRRRGETIGKLLKCIDDMKVGGHEGQGAGEGGATKEEEPLGGGASIVAGRTVLCSWFTRGKGET